jgi:hypothetical protein
MNWFSFTAALLAFLVGLVRYVLGKVAGCRCVDVAEQF